MKKIFISVLVLSAFSITGFAQKSASAISSSRQVTTDATITQQKAVKENKELNDQLTQMFGATYSLSDAKVIAQLQKNIDNVNVSPAIRKYSLYAVYGEKYNEHSYRLGNK